MAEQNERKGPPKKAGEFKTLFSKILITIGGSVILSYLVVGVIIVGIVISSVTRLSESELSAQSLAASNEIEGYFARYQEITEQLSLNTQMEQLFTGVMPGKNIDQTDGYTAAFETLVNVQKANTDTVLFVWMADVDSSQIAQSDGSVLNTGWDITTRAWYIELLEKNKTIMTEPYEDSFSKKQIVSVVSPVYKSGTTEIIGAVGLDFALEGLAETVGSYTLRDTGFYILSTGTGQIIYHPKEEFINHNVSETDMSENMKTAILSGTTGSIRYTSKGVPSHGYLMTIGETGWTIVTGLPNAEFNQEYLVVAGTLLIIFLLAILCIFFMITMVSKSIVKPIKELTDTANLIAEGNLDVEAKVVSKDEVGQMGEAINRTVVQLRRYIAYIQEIAAVLGTMAAGDMRIRLEHDYVGEFAPIKKAFEEISDSLNHTLSTIRLSAVQVSSSSEQVSGGAQALASGSTEQAATVEELNASSTEIAKQAEENLDLVKITTEQLKQTADSLNVGNQRMEQLSAAMADIESSANQIADITKVIDGIASQTNLLSLNAAIEAARAGEAGKGFAVVADEVRDLAQKSAEAAKQTVELLQNSLKSVETGTKVADETAQFMKKVEEDTLKVVEGISKIEEVSADQTISIDQIREGLNQVSAVIQTNAATAEENSATSEEMSSQAALLNEEVGKFKLY
ncbi:MAG: methyl-accepting chemotaxis protein [Lachnospiraceae bacterium]